jgi:hypothetical protein
MKKLAVVPGVASLGLTEAPAKRSRTCRGLKTADFRRLLSDLKRGPANEREFLRKLLKRAAAAKASTSFPVANLPNSDHAANP